MNAKRVLAIGILIVLLGAGLIIWTHWEWFLLHQQDAFTLVGILTICGGIVCMLIAMEQLLNGD